MFNEREKIKGRSHRSINFTSMGWRNNLDVASLIVFNEHGRNVEYTRYRFHFLIQSVKTKNKLNFPFHVWTMAQNGILK